MRIKEAGEKSKEERGRETYFQKLGDDGVCWRRRPVEDDGNVDDRRREALRVEEEIHAMERTGVRLGRRSGELWEKKEKKRKWGGFVRKKEKN